ncbi:MAG TPA: hypothetical protein VIK04_21105 [Solirubrobacteraceae bacterium]
MSDEVLTVERLEQWARSGAHLWVVALADNHAVVQLCACTGEPVERLESDNRKLIEYLQSAQSDLDLA